MCSTVPRLQTCLVALELISMSQGWQVRRSTGSVVSYSFGKIWEILRRCRSDSIVTMGIPAALQARVKLLRVESCSALSCLANRRSTLQYIAVICGKTIPFRIHKIHIDKYRIDDLVECIVGLSWTCFISFCANVIEAKPTVMIVHVFASIFETLQAVGKTARPCHKGIFVKDVPEHPENTDALTLAKLELLPELRLDGIHMPLGWQKDTGETWWNVVKPCNPLSIYFHVLYYILYIYIIC